jgi:hypothetical protein
LNFNKGINDIYYFLLYFVLFFYATRYQWSDEDDVGDEIQEDDIGDEVGDGDDDDFDKIRWLGWCCFRLALNIKLEETMYFARLILLSIKLKLCIFLGLLLSIKLIIVLSNVRHLVSTMCIFELIFKDFINTIFVVHTIYVWIIIVYFMKIW